MERDPENPRLEAGETSRAAAVKRTGLRGQPQAEGARSGGEDMGGPGQGWNGAALWQAAPSSSFCLGRGWGYSALWLVAGRHHH